MSRLNKVKLASLALAGLSAMASGSAFADGMTVDSNGGLSVFELDNKDYWFKIGGRLHLDTAMFESSANNERNRFPNGSQIRRSRVTFKGGVGNDWVYKVDYDFATTGTSSFGEAFLAYNGCKNVWLALGKVGTPFGLENWQSSNNSFFMESAMVTQALTPGSGIGGYAEWHGEMITLAGAVVHPEPATNQNASKNSQLPASDPISFGGRLTFSPVHDDHTVYHAGVSYAHTNIQESVNTVNFSTRPEIRGRTSPRLYTNIPSNSVKDYQNFGLELAARWGSLMTSGEYMHTHAKRDHFPDGNDARNPGGSLRYNGYYLMASYVLTGEVRDYDFASGTFGRVTPASSKGAWEIGVRHSYIKLLDMYALKAATMTNIPTSSAIDMVGNAHATTLGVTYWANENVRFLLNYSRHNFPDSIDVDAWGLRAQASF